MSHLNQSLGPVSSVTAIGTGVALVTDHVAVEITVMRPGIARVSWNTDAFARPTDGDPLYASLPFYIGLHSGLNYGTFLDNTHRTHFNFGASNDRSDAVPSP